MRIWLTLLLAVASFVEHRFLLLPSIRKLMLGSSKTSLRAICATNESLELWIARTKTLAQRIGA
jgi:hypothetical protein